MCDAKRSAKAMVSAEGTWRAPPATSVSQIAPLSVRDSPFAVGGEETERCQQAGVDGPLFRRGGTTASLILRRFVLEVVQQISGTRQVFNRGAQHRFHRHLSPGGDLIQHRVSPDEVIVDFLESLGQVHDQVWEMGGDEKRSNSVREFDTVYRSFLCIGAIS